MPFVEVPYRLEVEILGSIEPDEPTIVMRHPGLGSVSAWRDFPATVAEATGCAVVVYSRRGHGRSAPLATTPQPVDFMHRHATTDLPALLRTLEIRRPLLLGHSDGASIALLYAGSALDPAPVALALMAPHVFVEAETIAGAKAARRAFEHGSLRSRLALHHDDVDGAFHGWCDTWLLPEFRKWNIEDVLEHISCPVTVIQGLDDEYGTPRQVEAIRAGIARPVEAVLLERCGHEPQRDRPRRTLEAIVARVAAALTPSSAGGQRRR